MLVVFVEFEVAVLFAAWADTGGTSIVRPNKKMIMALSDRPLI